MKKILIVKLSALGDIIHLSWVLPALKKTYPNIQVNWVVDRRFERFLKLFIEIDEVIPWDIGVNQNPWFLGRQVLGQLKAIRKYHYDLTIDAQGLFRSAGVTFLSKANAKIGFPPPVSREGSYGIYGNWCWDAIYELNVVDKNLCLFKEIGIKNYQPSLPRLNFDAIPLGRVDAFIKKIGSQKKIIFNPSASFYTKFYPENGILPLAAEIKKRWGCPLIILNDGQMKNFQKIHNHTDVIITPYFSLEELALLFKKCDFLIGVDSGPSYIAELVGKPSLILFGPTNLERQSPSRSKDTALQSIFAPGEKTKNISKYSNYICPIIKPGVIYTPYRCLNRNCPDNLCMKRFDPVTIVKQVADIFND